MSIRKSVNGFTISTYQNGNIFETIIIDKNGMTVRACTDFSQSAARATHIKFCGLCR